jgi:lactate dehydrogenase-like 2-hydroxyacid dehydrogenase
MFKKLVSVDHTGIEEFVGNALNAFCDEVIFYNDYPTDDQIIIDRLKDADALLVSWNTKISQTVLEALPQLKYIGLCCSLITPEASNVAVNYAYHQNIKVTDVKHYGDDGVVEYILSELIQVIKSIKYGQVYTEQIELSDLKLGVIGLGILGEKVAKAAEFFGTEIAYYNRTEKESPYTYHTLESLVQHCDVITTHLPRHAQVMTKSLFKTFSNQKIFINTSLSPTYDLDAFMEWIQNPTHYAILDIESLTSEMVETYKKYPNITMSKQVSGFTKTARKRLAMTVLNNIKNAF